MKKICFMLALMVMSLTIKSYAATNLPLKIAGVQVTSGNMADPLGDGKLAVKPDKDKSTITIKVKKTYYYTKDEVGDPTDPWVDFTGDDTYTKLDVRLSGDWDTQLSIHVLGPCIRTSGDLTISSDADAFEAGYTCYLKSTGDNALEVGGNLTLNHPFYLDVRSEAKVGIQMHGVLTCKSSCVSQPSMIRGKQCAISGIQKFVDDPYTGYVQASKETHHTYIHDEQAYKPNIEDGLCEVHDGSSVEYIFLSRYSQEYLTEYDYIYPLSINGKRMTHYSAYTWSSNQFFINKRGSDSKKYWEATKYEIQVLDGAELENINYSGDVPLEIYIQKQSTDKTKSITIGGKNPIKTNGALTINCPANYTINIINSASTATTGNNNLIESTFKNVTFEGSGRFVLHQVNTVSSETYVFKNCANVKFSGYMYIDIDKNDETFLSDKATSIQGLNADSYISGYEYDANDMMIGTQVTWNKTKHVMEDKDGKAYAHFHYYNGLPVKYYNIKVAGKQITNMDNHVFGDCAIYANGNLYINEDITCSGPVISTCRETLSIAVENGVKLTSTDDNCIYMNYGDVTLYMPNGELHAKDAGVYLQNTATFTFEGGNVKMTDCKYGIRGGGNARVINHDACIQIESTNEAITSLNEFDLGNMAIQVPEGAYFSKEKKGVVDKNGNLVKGKVTINTGNSYNLYVNDVQLTDQNKSTIATGVSFSYNKSEGIGTLTITPDAASNLKITSKSKDTEGVISPAALVVDAEMGAAMNMTIGSITYYKNLKIKVNGTNEDATLVTGNISCKNSVFIMKGSHIEAKHITAEDGTLILSDSSRLYLTSGAQATDIAIPQGMGIIGGTFNKTKKQFLDKDGNVATKLLFCTVDFPIIIDGTRITAYNYEKPFAFYDISFDPFTNTIILTDVERKTDKVFLEVENKIPTLYIQFNGTNTITSTQEVIKTKDVGKYQTTLQFYGQDINKYDYLTMQSTGTAAISLDNSFILGEHPTRRYTNGVYDVISIEGATYAVESQGETAGITGVYDPGQEKIHFKFKGNAGSVNSAIQYGGVYGADKFNETYLNPDDTPYTGWLWCGKAPFTYGFKVAGIQVTEINSADVLQDGGSVRYEDPYDEYGSNALVLDNATINAADSIGLEVQKDGWKLYIKGNCTINSRNTGMQLAGSTLYIWNYPDTENHLYINSNTTACSVVADHSCFWGVDATLKGNIGLQGIHAAEDAEEAGNCKLRFENDAILTAQGEYASVLGFDDIDLTNYYIKAPANATYEKGIGVLVNTLYTSETVAFVPTKFAAVEDVNNDNDATIQKVIRDGQLLIIRNGKTYNALGAVVE